MPIEMDKEDRRTETMVNVNNFLKYVLVVFMIFAAFICLIEESIIGSLIFVVVAAVTTKWL